MKMKKKKKKVRKYNIIILNKYKLRKTTTVD